MSTSIVDFFSNLLDINHANLSGCIDIIVVRQPDGSLKSTPFHVRFGKLKLLKSSQKTVNLIVNGHRANLAMKLGNAGEAYFVEETHENEMVAREYQTSPIGSPKHKYLSAEAPPEIVFSGSDSDENGAQEAKELTREEEQIKEKQIKEASDDQEIKDLKEMLNQSPSQLLEKVEAAAQEEESQAAAKIPEKQRKSRWSWFWGKPPKKNKIEQKSKESQKSEEEAVCTVQRGESKDDLELQKIHHQLNLQKINEEIESVENSEDFDLPLQKIRSKSLDFQFQETQEEKRSSEAQLKEEQNTKTEKTEKKGIFSSFFGKIFSRSKKERNANKLEQKDGDKSTPQISILEPQGASQNISDENSQNDENRKQSSAKGLFRQQKPDTNKPPLLERYETIGSDEDEENKSERVANNQEEEEDVALSLCGNLIQNSNHRELREIFEMNKVPFHEFSKNPLKILTHPHLLIRVQDKLYDWKTAAPLILSLLAYHQPLPNETMAKLTRESQESISNRASSPQNAVLTPSPPMSPSDKSSVASISEQALTTALDHNINPAPRFLSSKSGHEQIKEESKAEQAKPAELEEPRRIRFKKSLSPSSNQLEQLGLHDGINEIIFSVTSTFQGNQNVKCRIFMWQHNDKIVISDIDGTITRSDVMGQVMPIFGKDWTHKGVTRFFTNIAKNGYRMAYLTARAIGQSEQTRKFILKVQQGQETLPLGPVIMSPDRLIPALKREVIHRKPQVARDKNQQFKIAALRNIKSLFPQDSNPFYAGFGNRDSVRQSHWQDTISYRAVGVELGKIFKINERSEITQFNTNYLKSYPLLNELVDQMFPQIRKTQVNIVQQCVDQRFNDLNFWKPKVSLTTGSELDYDSEIIKYI